MHQQFRPPSKCLVVFIALLGIPSFVALIGIYLWTKSRSFTDSPGLVQPFRPAPSRRDTDLGENNPQREVELKVTEAEAEIIASMMSDLGASRDIPDAVLTKTLVLAKDLGFDAKTQFLTQLISVQSEVVSRNSQKLLFFVAGWDLDASKRMKIAHKLLPIIESTDFKAGDAAIHLLTVAAIPKELFDARRPTRQNFRQSEIERCLAIPIQNLIDKTEYGRLKVELGEDIAKACIAVANRNLDGPWFKSLPESARLQIAEYFVRQFVKAASPEMAKQRTIDRVEAILGGAGLGEYVSAITNTTKDLQKPLPVEVLDEWVSALESPSEFHHDFILWSGMSELANQSVPALRNRALISIVNRALTEKDPRYLSQFTQRVRDQYSPLESSLASSVSTRVFDRLARTSWSDSLVEMLSFSDTIAKHLDSVEQRSYALSLLARGESSTNPGETIAILRSISGLKPEFDRSEISRYLAAWKESFRKLNVPDYEIAVYWERLSKLQAWHPIVLDQEWVDFFLRDLRIAGPRLESDMEQSLQLIVGSQEQRLAVAKLNGKGESIKLILQSALLSDSDRAEATILELLSSNLTPSFREQAQGKDPLPRILELLRSLDHNALLRINSACLPLMKEGRPESLVAARIQFATIQQLGDANKLGIDSFPPNAIHWLTQDQFEQARTLVSGLSRERAEGLCNQSLTFLDGSDSDRRLRHTILLCDMVKSGIISVDKVLTKFLESNRREEFREAKTILDSLIPFLSLEVIEQKLRVTLNNGDGDRLSFSDLRVLSKFMERWMSEAAPSRVDALMTELLTLSRRLDSRSRARQLLVISKFRNRSSQCLEFCKQLWNQEPNETWTLEQAMSFLEGDDQEKFRDHVRERIESLVNSDIQQKGLKDYLRTLPKLLPVKEIFGILESSPAQVDVADFVFAIATKYEELSMQEKQKLLTLWADQVRLSNATQVERVGAAIAPLRSEMENWRPGELLPRLIQLLPQSQQVLAILSSAELSMAEIKDVIGALTKCEADDVSDTLRQYAKLADHATCDHEIETLETRWKSAGIASLKSVRDYVVILENRHSDDRDFVIAALKGLGILYSTTCVPSAKRIVNEAEECSSIILMAISERLAISRYSRLGVYSIMEYCKRFGLLVDDTQLLQN